MLEYINIKNFKSIKELSLNLKKINIFIGANRTGKSSVFQAIMLLKQSESQITWDGSLIKLRELKKVLHNQAEGQKIAIEFGGKLAPTQKIINNLRLIEPIRFGMHVGLEARTGAETGAISELGYSIGSGAFEASGNWDRNTGSPSHIVEREDISFTLYTQPSIRFPENIQSSVAKN